MGMFISTLLLNPWFAAPGLYRWLVQALCVLCLCGKRPSLRRGWHRPAATIRTVHAHPPAPSPSRRKPDWVRREVLRLAVFVVSCRRTADAFNRLHGWRMTVSHGFAHEVCKANAELLAARRRAMRRRLPWPMPRNAVWALDLTQLPTADGGRQSVLGLVDHGTRRALHLRAVARKCTWTLLGHLCLVFAEFGKPCAIRTDNEGMFNSRLWQRALRWMGIRHRRSTPGCPWQNGRIERLFGTLKQALRGMVFPGQAVAQAALDEFASFYNHARPHRNLGGLTPIEAWHGVSWRDVLQQAGRGRWVQALDGRLVAYHLRL